MTARLRGSEEAFARASQVLAGGVSSGIRRSVRPHPVFFVAGEGPRLKDVNGSWFVDHVLGWGQAILGHGHPAQSAAVAEQLSKGTGHGGGSQLEVAVAERVLARVPGVERLLWATTGSEAVQLALRLARAHTGRNRFLKFAGHYHGWSDTMLLGAMRADSDPSFGVESRGQNPRLRADVDVVPFGELDGVRAALEAPGSDIAAVFVDPLMCNAGLIAPPPGFLQGLRALCDEHGVLLVFDEVITGFRVAPGGAIELFGVQPDLVVFAKAISGGFPLSAVAGRRDVLELVLDGVFYSGTYNGNLVSLAASGACLDVLGEPGVYPTFDELGRRLALGLASAFEEHGVGAEVRQVGPVLHCSVAPGVGGPSGADVTYAQVAERLLDHGVYAAPDGRLYISTAHTHADIDTTIDAYRRALGQV